MSEDYRLKLFLDMWERDVASGKTTAALHDWSKQHNAEDDTRFEVLTTQLNGLREDLAREQGFAEGARAERQSFTSEIQTGRHLLPTPEQLEAARLQYAQAQPSTPLVNVSVQSDRHHSHRPSAIPPVLLKAFSSGAAKVAGLIAVALFGAFVRHCAPVIVDALQQHPQVTAPAPAPEPRK